MKGRSEKPRVIVSVINDLSTDQRVRRSCALLHDLGYDVILLGRVLPKSPDLPDRPYRMKRFRLPFHKGAAFYASYNLRLLFYLIFHRADMLYANDLDTLLPNVLVKFLRRVKLIYDSHELFTEVPELVKRKRVQATWRLIETKCIQHADAVVTVNDSIAKELNDRYGVSVAVVRNIPELFDIVTFPSRESIGLPLDKKIIILQGSGINIQRGAEEALEAMQYLDDHLLVIAGSGDVIPLLKRKADEFGISDKVLFVPRQAYKDLMRFTVNADLGLSLDKDTNLNYRYSLPNKLFDYLHAGLPVLVSDLPEISAIVKKYDVGEVLTTIEPRIIADAIEGIFSNLTRYQTWKDNTRTAKNDLNWENEQVRLTEIITKVEMEVERGGENG